MAEDFDIEALLEAPYKVSKYDIECLMCILIDLKYTAFSFSFINIFEYIYGFMNFYTNKLDDKPQYSSKYYSFSMVKLVVPVYVS